MHNARYVGRVGALAVALGIGAAVVAVPGAAFAEPTGSAPSSSADTEPAKVKSRHSEQDSPSSSDSPSTGGADADDDSDEGDPSSGDTPPGSASDGGDNDAESGTATRKSHRSNRDEGPCEAKAEATTPKADTTPTGADAVSAPAEPPPAQPNTPVTPSAPAGGDLSVEPAPAPAGAPQPSAPPAVPTTVLTNVTTTQGTDGPAAPVDASLLWTVLTFARRQFGHQRAEIEDSGAPTATELVDPGAAAVPEPGEITIGDPGFFTGSVSGRVTATDPDGGRVTYSGSAETDKGKVTVLPWGTFRYTPTEAARHAAAAQSASAADKVDTFTVTVTDSNGESVTVPVTVDIAAKNAVPSGVRADAGAASLTTGTIVVTVSADDLDGDTLTFTGPLPGKGALVDNGDGTFTYTPTAAARQAAGAPGAPAGAKSETLIFVVDDGHGGIRTATVDVAITPYSTASSSTPGRAAGPVVVSSTGTVYQVTYEVDPVTLLPTGTRVSILDEDGKVVRTTGGIAGAPVEQTPAAARPDGTLILTTYRSSTNSTIVSIVDGQGVVTKIGTVTGQPTVPLAVAPNGTVFLQTGQVASNSGDRLVRISAAGKLRVYSVGKTGGTLAVAPDGSAYVVAVSAFGSASVLAVGPDGDSRKVSLPWGAATPNDVVIGADGRGYLTVARKFFGITTTRIYTFTGTSNTVREIPGVPAGVKIVTSNGVYQATYDASTGRSYIAKITATTIATSDPVTGSVLNRITVTPDGTVFVSVRNLGTQVDSVAVVNVNGDVSTIAVPGTIVGVLPGVPSVGGDEANPNIANQGYVAYTSGGTTYLAVITSNGTIARTVALPQGASVRNPVSFAPDGTPYQVIQFRDADGRVTSQAVLALSTDTATATLPGSAPAPNFPQIQFGPDGTAFLVTVESATFTHHFLGIDETGATVVTLDVTGTLVPQQANYVYDQRALVFGPDGTAYATFGGAAAGVWALTSGAATKVLDLDLGAGETVSAVAFGVDGTPYVTVSERVGGAYVTTVKTFTPPVTVL